MQLQNEELAELDELYVLRGADGRPVAWGRLVERLRAIRRRIEIGETVGVHDGLQLKSVSAFLTWAYRQYKTLEDGYDSWIGDDES